MVFTGNRPVIVPYFTLQYIRDGQKRTAYYTTNEGFYDLHRGDGRWKLSQDIINNFEDIQEHHRLDFNQSVYEQGRGTTYYLPLNGIAFNDVSHVDIRFAHTREQIETRNRGRNYPSLLAKTLSFNKDILMDVLNGDIPGQRRLYHARGNGAQGTQESKDLASNTRALLQEVRWENEHRMEQEGPNNPPPPPGPGRMDEEKKDRSKQNSFNAVFETYRQEVGKYWRDPSKNALKFLRH